MKIKEQLEYFNGYKDGLYNSYKLQDDIINDRLKKLIVEYLTQCMAYNQKFDVELIHYDLYNYIFDYIKEEISKTNIQTRIDYLKKIESDMLLECFKE